MGSDSPGDRHDEGSEDESAVMPLGDHLEELRSRLIRCITLLGAAFIVAWLFRGHIMAVIKWPHVVAMTACNLDPVLKFRTYVETPVAQLKACLIAAAIVASPVLIYQIWAFVAPALFRHERQVVFKLGAASLVCLGAGVCFGYFLFIPLALRFLLRLSGAEAEPALMIGPYLSQFFLLTLALGVVFQTPVVIFYLVRWGVLDIETVQKQRKLAILAIFVLAAFFTPPDPFTQLMMALPLIALYDLGALLAAPSRATLRNFATFAGTVCAVVAVVAAGFYFWPVGSVTALKGVVRAKADLVPGETKRLRRGEVCATEPDAAAKVSLGRGKAAPVLLLAGGTRLQVHSKGSVSLYEGRILATSPASGAAVEVRTPSGRAVIENAEAELLLPDPEMLTVAVAEGHVTVVVDGEKKRIGPGRAATFRGGGEPIDESAIRKRWEQLIEDAGRESQ